MKECRSSMWQTNQKVRASVSIVLIIFRNVFANLNFFLSTHFPSWQKWFWLRWFCSSMWHLLKVNSFYRHSWVEFAWSTMLEALIREQQGPHMSSPFLGASILAMSFHLILWKSSHLFYSWDGFECREFFLPKFGFRGTLLSILK